MKDRPEENPGTEAPGTTWPGAPRRTSMRDRMAQAPSRVTDLASPTAGDPSDLTSTSLAALTSISDYSTAFTVSETGVSRTDAFAPISAPIATTGPAGVISRQDADSHHLLLLPDEVDPAEIEALALSIWDGACWAGAGRLHLLAGARLEGPWAIDAPTRQALRTPSSMTKAWILRCPTAKRKPVPAELARVDEWAPYFPEGLPVGIEYRVLLALKRIARRLGGALRIADSGRVIQPDPDSAVSLAIYTSRWLEPAELVEVLRTDFPNIVDSRDVPVAVAETRSTGAAEGASASRTDVVTKIEHARRAAREAKAAQVVSGYALLVPIANRSELIIEVQPVPTPPQVLRWEAWTTGVIIEYQLKWIPQEGMGAPAPVSRARRLERVRSARDIERAAGIIIGAVGGSVIDEDGFLVALDDEAVIE